MGKIGYWVVRTWKSGCVGEKTKFWVPGARPDKRSRRAERAASKKQRQNEYAAEKTMARLINANFGEGDLLLGLDYSPEGIKKLEARAGLTGTEPEDVRLTALYQAAQQELTNCLRRVQRAAKQGGEQLHYIAVTSDMDGDTGETVRVHHHLIVDRETKELFREKWTLGGVAWSPLSKQEDYTAVAAYLIRQVRHVDEKNKYTSSRNLLRPRPNDRVAVSGAELRVPAGGELLYRAAHARGEAQYIRYVLPEVVKMRPWNRT